MWTLCPVTALSLTVERCEKYMCYDLILESTLTFLKFSLVLSAEKDRLCSIADILEEEDLEENSIVFDVYWNGMEY